MDFSSAVESCANSALRDVVFSRCLSRIYEASSTGRGFSRLLTRKIVEETHGARVIFDRGVSGWVLISGGHVVAYIGWEIDGGRGVDEVQLSGNLNIFR